jgi:hypothetical protein
MPQLTTSIIVNFRLIRISRQKSLENTNLIKTKFEYSEGGRGDPLRLVKEAGMKR